MIPYKITAFDAASAIKDTAKTKDPVHYAEIVDVDVIVKEYKVHKPCYKMFVKDVSATTSRSEMRRKMIVNHTRVRILMKSRNSFLMWF